MEKKLGENPVENSSLKSAERIRSFMKKHILELLAGVFCVGSSYLALTLDFNRKVHVEAEVNCMQPENARSRTPENAKVELRYLDDKEAAYYMALQAQVFMELGDYQSAEQWISLAISYDRMYADYYMFRSYIYFQLGEEEKIVKDWENAAILGHPEAISILQEMD